MDSGIQKRSYPYEAYTTEGGDIVPPLRNASPEQHVNLLIPEYENPTSHTRGLYNPLCYPETTYGR